MVVAADHVLPRKPPKAIHTVKAAGSFGLRAVAGLGRARTLGGRLVLVDDHEVEQAPQEGVTSDAVASAAAAFSLTAGRLCSKGLLA